MKNRVIFLITVILLFGAAMPNPAQSGDVSFDILPFFKKHSDADCAAICLVQVLNYWGMDITDAELKGMLGPAPREGYSLSSLKRRAEFLGFRAFLFSGTVEDIARQCSAGRPCIIAYQKSSGQNHAVVVFDVQPGLYGDFTVKILDPNDLSDGVQTCGFKPIWNGWIALGSPVLLVGKES